MIRKIFLQLISKDLAQFRRIFAGKLFDTCFLFFTNVAVFGYFMPKLGLSDGYGSFILIGAISSFGLFDTIGQVGEIIFDIEGDRTITFTLSLPLPSYMVFMQLALKWALQCFLLCVPLFLIGKLILWEGFDLGLISLGKLILIFPTVCLFYGIFSLWLVGVITKINSIASLFLRFINPIFMFGGYFFTWQASYELSPIVAYAILINPMIYVMEGMRAACLGQQGYLPFWYCLAALWGFILVLGSHAVRRLRHRLDCV